MDMKNIIIVANVLISLAVSINATAQCEAISEACANHISTSYIPDGQFHYAMLNEDETAEFAVTLFGETTYRLAACSGTNDGNLFFTVYDKDHNELFSNRDHESAPYWDFVVANTLDVTVEANLDNEKVSSGCAVLMLGFKK
jgi:hypothetical protein